MYQELKYRLKYRFNALTPRSRGCDVSLTLLVKLPCLICTESRAPPQQGQLCQLSCGNGKSGRDTQSQLKSTSIPSHAPPVWCDTGSLWMRRTWEMKDENPAAGLADHCRSLPTELFYLIPNSNYSSLDICHFVNARCCSTIPPRKSTSNETPNTIALCKMWCACLSFWYIL